MTDRPGGRRSGVRRVLLEYELRQLARDTRTILIAVVAPLILFPAMIFLTILVEEREERRLEETVYQYAVVGDSADWARSLIAAALALPVDSSEAPTTFTEVEAPADVPTTPVLVDSLLAESDAHVIVRGLSAGAWRALRLEQAEATGVPVPSPATGPPDPSSATEAPAPSPAAGRRDGVPVLSIDYRVSSDFERRAATVLRDRLEELRGVRRDSIYRARGFPVDPGEVAAVEAINAASAQREAGAWLGLALTPFLLLLMLTGGSIVAVDAISGEKERGTLETLLTTAATRSEIVQAKLGAVVLVGLVVALVNVLNLLVYLVLGVIELPAQLSVDLGLVDLGLLLFLLLPLTVLVGSALLLLSGWAKSYKEYQIYFFPLFLVLLFASLASTLPGMELRSVVAFIPISGVGVAVREVMVGQRDWPFLLLTFLSTSAAAFGLAHLTERALSTEKLVSGSELDEADLVGGPALFRRHALRWFMVMWAVFFLGSNLFGVDLSLRQQVATNILGLFFISTLLMIRIYRLPVADALAFRMPRPGVWLAVLIGAPSALMVGLGIAELVNRFVFPVPPQVLEAFSNAIVGDDLPLWQLILFLAVIPGIFEELAFRGVLVYGLRKALRPLALCLVVGVIFGMFHVSLFRIVPTAYLGVVLTAVVLLTGSIYPAMLWHFLNNFIGIVPAQLGWIDADAPLPEWSWAAGAAGLALAFWILWRSRTPYPDLKGSVKGERGSTAE